MAMKDPQARTKQIIKDDIETIRAYADAFGVDQADDSSENGGASQNEPFFPQTLADRGQGAPERIQPGGFGIEVASLAGRAGIHHEIQLDILEPQLRQLPE